MISIRPAQPEDAERLAHLGERTFRQTYTDNNTEENLNAHVAESFSPEKQLAEILDREMTTILLEIDDSLGGFVQIRTKPCPAGISNANDAELWRIYVDRDYHGNGYGSRLLKAAIEAAQVQANQMWLGVWEGNEAAFGFYTARGFRVVGEHDFVVGDDVQRDLVMAINLS